MDCFILIVEFFAGLVVLFAVGALIGHIFKLDEYLKHDPLDHSRAQNT